MVVLFKDSGLCRVGLSARSAAVGIVPLGFQFTPSYLPLGLAE